MAVMVYLPSVSSTPLIKLSKLSAETGCTIAVKGEHQNPGGSVKDRAALFLIREAEEKGENGWCWWW
jgi:cysteine synthase A